MNCRHCSANITANDRFCDECGSALESTARCSGLSIDLMSSLLLR